MARKPLPSNAKSHNGYSADEFQRQLLTWFQDRGLLSDLQAHLRHQMIVALRDTSLNINSAGSFHQAGSPKLQAINLLVAEFLLRQECHYTLSVFTSEVPLLRNLPEFSSAINNTGTGGGRGADDKFPGFHERDVFDILEALGFSPNSEESQRINELYEHSHGEALLTCLIRSLPDKFRSSVKALCEKCESPEHGNENNVQEVFLHTPLFDKEIQNLLLELNIGSHPISQLHIAFKRIVEEELKKVQKEEEAKYHTLLIEREQRIQELWQKHDEKIQERLVRAGEKLKDKQSKLSKELGQKHAHLAVLAAQLKEQQNEVSNRLNYVQERSDLLEQKEVELKVFKKKSEEYLIREQQKLEEREKQIEQQLVRLNAETQAREQERKELEANRIQIEQASQAIKESQSEIALLRDMQRQHSLLFKAAEVKHDSKEKQPVPSRKKIVQFSSQAVQVDLNKHKGAISRKHNVHQQTVRVPCEDQSLQTQISGNDMEDVFMHLRVQSTENERRRSQHEMMNNMVEHLEQENTELRGHIAQQRLRIEELTAHSSQLMRHLNEVNNSLTRLRNQPASRQTDHQGVQTSPTSDSSPVRPVPIRNSQPTSSANGYQVPPHPVPPQPSVPSGSRTPFRGFIRSNQMGAGEESYFCRRLPPESYVPLYSPSYREHRRKPLRRLMVHSVSSSEESSPSPTEEMLCKARHRLRILEEETAAVDRSYQEFRLRHVDSLTNSASILFQPVSSKFGTPDLSNTPTATFVHNPLSTPTSSRSRFLQPQVPLINQIPSTSGLQPGVLNTALLYPSSGVSEQRRQLYNPSQLQSNMNINLGHPASAGHNSIPNSSLWRRPVTSNVQTPLIASNAPTLVKDPRNAMRLPAAFNLNEQPRLLTVNRDSDINTQRSQHSSRPQQEPPPCIVSAPHILVPESETLINNPSSHAYPFQANLAQDNGKSRMRNLNQQAQHKVSEPCPPGTDKSETPLQFEVIKDVPTKFSSYTSQQQSLQPTIENLGSSENENELELSRDESQSKDTTNASNNNKEKSNNVRNEKETSDNTNSFNKNVFHEEESTGKKTENVASDLSTGESIASINGNKSAQLEEGSQNGNDGSGTPSLLSAKNDITRDKIISKDEDLISNKVEDQERQDLDPSKIEESSPASIVDDEHVVLSNREQFSTSNREKLEGASDNVNCENRVQENSVPAVCEPTQKNCASDSVPDNIDCNNLKISPVKSEDHGERLPDVLLNDTLREHSNSPSSPSIIGSSNEVSSDVISAGSAGGEKSDDTW